MFHKCSKCFYVYLNIRSMRYFFLCHAFKYYKMLQRWAIEGEFYMGIFVLLKFIELVTRNAQPNWLNFSPNFFVFFIFCFTIILLTNTKGQLYENLPQMSRETYTKPGSFCLRSCANVRIHHPFFPMLGFFFPKQNCLIFVLFVDSQVARSKKT